MHAKEVFEAVNVRISYRAVSYINVWAGPSLNVKLRLGEEAVAIRVSSENFLFGQVVVCY